MKLNHKNIFSIIFITLCFCISAYADDSFKINVRRPSHQRIEKFHKNDDFNYGTDFNEPEGFMERIWIKIGRMINAFLNKTNYDNFWKYIFIAVIITTLMLIVLKILGKEFNSIFRYNKKSIGLPYEVLNENIHEMDFDILINKAIENRNYRLAIRFWYLKSLKTLAEQNIINWHLEKTNRSYLLEISDETLREQFYKLTKTFEFAWYGEMPVSETNFLAEQNRFKAFNSSI